MYKLDVIKFDRRRGKSPPFIGRKGIERRGGCYESIGAENE